VLQVV